MKFSEAVIYYNYNMASMARAIGISKQWVYCWKRNNKIPIHYQCMLEIVTNGALIADRTMLKV